MSIDGIEARAERLQFSPYSGMLIDVDGTLRENVERSVPSKRVKDRILQAKNMIHIGLATGQSLIPAKQLSTDLMLDAPSVINNGATIISSAGDVLWQCPLLLDDVKAIAAKVKGTPQTEIRNVYEFGPFTNNYQPKEPIGIYIYALKPDRALEITQSVLEIPTVTVHSMVSYTPGLIDLDITHVEAVKENGLMKWAALVGISPREIIAIGDGYNDRAFLLKAGLGIAMGNAVPELKKIAHHIAPSVENDGVADTIERFVLRV